MSNLKKIEILRSNERGYANHGWLKSYHSFSFANYYNPKQMGFSDLRVINDDVIEANKGFGMHSHKNMEIFSYVTEGKLAHKDSMNNEETILTNEVQLMSAGSGVMHSEFNPSNNESTHLFQIWIMPNTMNEEPTYQQKSFSDDEKRGKLKLIVSPEANNGSLKIKQNTYVYAGLFDEIEHTSFNMEKNRSYFIHVIKGHVSFNEISLSKGDALKIFEGEGLLSIHNAKDAEILFFDLDKH